ncbi:reverse transcriptase-like protein [Gracilibacillus caseinilyticus]|uniref:Reverse transcriptase-like protein n=1 Tax=Gracilibacillus caseinilyticus TaxID=2932256 RepID=A0ABY4EXD2_9BACI|nr:reverse transcriptase-like protein [Gracilibacillus caseinilyticus]UOQ49074.1 reverse transcriptase-like protein [Gracilibacillus caseinilyticus]
MQVTMEWTYRTPKGTKASFYSEQLHAKEALMVAADMEKWQRIESLMFVDYRGNRWSEKQLLAYTEEIVTEPHDITVFFDGGFELAQYKAGLGCVVYYHQNGKAYRQRFSKFLEEINTNNEAEYASLYQCLELLEELGVHDLPVTFKGDSKVVIHQLAGEWPCMEETLNRWADKIEWKLNQMGIDPVYQSIPRKENNEAHKLAAKALDGVETNSTIEV